MRESETKGPGDKSAPPSADKGTEGPKGPQGPGDPKPDKNNSNNPGGAGVPNKGGEGPTR